MNYQEIIQKQRDYFNTHQTKDVTFRIEQLKKLKAVIKSQESALYEAIFHDFKKSEFDTFSTELSFIYHDIEEAIQKIPKWARRKRVATNLPNLPATSYIIAEPLGVCLVIGAWNYPYQLSLSPLIAAIASGNTVVLKPSEIPSATSAAMAKIIHDNFPPELIYVVEGGIMETTGLLEEKFDKIFFTGSTTVGKLIYQAAARHLTPVTLELGGKSPVIVTRNCHLKVAAKRIVWAKFLNAGQTCIAPDYVLVDEAVQQELLLLIKAYIQKFDYSFENHNYVQIINDKNFHRLTALIDETNIYFGGESNLQQRYIAPTVLTNISLEDAVMVDEIFGPLLPVISYSDLNDALQYIVSRPKPLACYIFTNDTAVRDKILKEISFGGGCVNDTIMHITNDHLPFGGVGMSGMGSYHGNAGFRAFSHFKSIHDKGCWPDPNLKYPPYTEKKLHWIKLLMGK